MLSVIVPVFNMDKYIGPCVSGILGFHDADMEVIVVDDGSTDGTAAVLGSIPDARLKVVRERHRGVSAARNTGFRHSRGHVILPFDADDIPVVENWYSVIAALLADPGGVLAYGESREFRNGTDDFPRSVPLGNGRPKGGPVPHIFKQNFLPVGAAFVRREAIETAGVWNENLEVGEDWDMWCRLACLGRFVYCPMLVMGVRVHAQSATGVPVSGRRPDPGMAAVEAIYSHQSVKLKTGALYRSLKRKAVAWQTYLWARRLVRSGAYWSGAKAFVRTVVLDPRLFFHACAYPKRRIRQMTEQG